MNAKDDTTKACTRELRLSALKSFFGFAAAKAYCVGNPSKLVRVRLKDLSHEQKETVARMPITEHEFNHIVMMTRLPAPEIGPLYFDREHEALVQVHDKAVMVEPAAPHEMPDQLSCERGERGVDEQILA